MKTLRVGILGAGYMGRLHGRNLVRQRGVVVGAVCSRPIETAQVLSRELTGGRAACYDDFDRLLGERRLDALYVCLPPFAHEGQVQAAALCGREGQPQSQRLFMFADQVAPQQAFCLLEVLQRQRDVFGLLSR